jgi:hypothetical protein
MHQIVRVLEALDRWDKSIYKLAGHDGYTVTMVAKAIHLKPSSHLRKIMDACVTAGWLTKEGREYRVTSERFLYSITPLGSDMVQELAAQRISFG